MTDYTYDEQRPDRLTMYNGESFSYDLIGNPVTYRDKSLAWEKGRQLKRYDGYIFGYDGYGKRISKGSTFYGYVGDRLVEERTGDNVLEYMYDETGVRSIVNNGASYYWIKNLQGNVISLIDTTGKIVVKYTYDAWGNHIATGSDGTVIYHSARGVTDGYENHIGNLNPIRYRGYYYDTETGLFYVTSRYYDPEVGRFINADDVSEIRPDRINGLNLYSYCGNDPVNRIDPTGRAWWNWVISGLQIVTGAILVATGVGAGFGAMLLAGGVMGMVSNALGSQIGGGLGSMMNGWGAISTGISLMGFGPIGIIAGIILIGIGATTMVMGANEVVAGITGTNYIQQWTGMSDVTYGGLYLGLNIASSVATIAGRLGMRAVGTRTTNSRPQQSDPYARHISENGNFDARYNGRGKLSWSRHTHNTVKGNNMLHWHTEMPHSGEIYNYFSFLIALIFGG